MKKHEFTVILSGISEITDEVAIALFEAGCDDRSPGSCDGVVSVASHRDAESLEEAMGSAVSDIRRAPAWAFAQRRTGAFRSRNVSCKMCP